MSEEIQIDDSEAIAQIKKLQTTLPIRSSPLLNDLKQNVQKSIIRGFYITMGIETCCGFSNVYHNLSKEARQKIWALIRLDES